MHHSYFKSTPFSYMLLALLLPSMAFARVVSPNASAAEQQGLASLPLEAQVGISSALGQDQKLYHARSEGKAIRLSNPQHGLTAVFTAEGVAVESGGSRFQMSFLGVGRGARYEAISSAEKEATANRIIYRRAGVTEWYVNGPLGLAQGFTLDKTS